MKIYLQALILGLLLTGCNDHAPGLGPVFRQQPGEKIERRTLRLHHPSFGEDGKREVSVSRRVGRNGFPVEYGMWVDSVYCADGKCEVVNVKMYWDALGRFTRYELPPGTVLTKQDHVPFTDVDYARLQAILQDRNSALRTHSLKELTRPVATAGLDATSQRVDAVTQATQMSVKDAVVPGATYTSFNLWHWANGEAEGAIRELTHRNCSKALLLHFLQSERPHEVLFGIEHLGRHGILDNEAVTEVMAAMRGGENDRMDAGVAYLRTASPCPETFYERLGRLFGDSHRRGQIYLLDLFAKEDKLPEVLYRRLAAEIPRLGEHYELHLLLNLLDKGNYVSAEVLGNAATFLDHPNFFMARRAFWFLQEKELSPELRAKLKKFQEKNADRL